jgi:GH25 family lysozyme M1 (1,4-beta-N-acetylmuramidase)
MSVINGGLVGFDISHYQSVRDSFGRWTFPDFQKMKDYGAKFVICKAGQYNFEDITFKVYYQKLKEVGLPRASYWFLDSRAEGKAQAQKYWDIIKDEPGEGPLVVDYEHGSGGDWRKLYDFVVEIQRLSGYPNHKIWIYTGYYYWIDNSPTSIFEREWFAKYPLWLAYYAENYQVPDMWTDIVCWQKGTPTIGLDAGVLSREIDYNIFNGDENKLAEYFDGVTAPPPPPNEEGSMKGTVLPNYTLLVRDAAGNGTTKRLYGGDVVYGDVVNHRISFQRIYRANGTVEEFAGNAATVNPLSLSTVWIKLENIAEPAPPATVRYIIQVMTDGSLIINGVNYP